MLASIVLSLVVGAAPSARSTTWIPLVKVGASFDDSWKSSLEAATELQLNKKKRTKMVQAPATSIDNTMVAMGCSSWGPSCAHQIGDAMGAKRKLMVDVVAKGEGATIGFRLIDRRGRVIQKAGPFLLPDRGREGRTRALKAVRAFIFKKQPTELVFETTPPGATVRINGRKQRKKTPFSVAEKYAAEKPLKVELSLKGYKGKSVSVSPVAGAPTPVSVELESVAKAVAVVPPDEPPETKAASTPKAEPDGGQAPDTTTDKVALAESPPPDERNAEGTAPETADKAPPTAPVAAAESSTENTSPSTEDLAPPGGGVTGEGASGGGGLAPVLMWSGATTLGVAGVGAIGAAAPWAVSAVLAATNAGCRPPEFNGGTIDFYCTDEVLEDGTSQFGGNSHFFPWVGLPVAALVGAAGAGLLVSSFFLGSDPLDEDATPPPAPAAASLLPPLDQE